MPKQLELFTSEWGVRNDVAHLIDPLNELLPMFGMVKNANKNKALEKFRKAQGVAYDIFNNGLINRGKSLKVLGLKNMTCHCQNITAEMVISQATGTGLNQLFQRH